MTDTCITAKTLAQHVFLDNQLAVLEPIRRQKIEGLIASYSALERDADLLWIERAIMLGQLLRKLMEEQRADQANWSGATLTA